MASKRAVVAVVGCLVVGLAVEGYRPAAHVPAASASAEAPATPEPVEASLPDPPPPIETPYRVVLAALPRETFPDVEQRGATVRVRYRMDHWMLTDTMGRHAFDQNAAQLVPELLARFPAVSTVEIEADAATRDIRGNRGRGAAASVTFTRRNAGTIHWEAIDYASIQQLADRSWYGPGFR